MEVSYKGSLQNIITEYDTLNIKAGISGVAYSTMLMKGLPQQIFKQLSTVNPADKNRCRVKGNHLKRRKECGNMAGNRKEFWNDQKLKVNGMSFGNWSSTKTFDFQKTQEIGEQKTTSRQISGKRKRSHMDFQKPRRKNLCANGRRSTKKRN
jgi:hypothetical protein